MEAALPVRPCVQAVPVVIDGRVDPELVEPRRERLVLRRDPAFQAIVVPARLIERTGVTAEAIRALDASGVSLADPGVLFGATFLLSNLVSNVPAVMLLLPAATEPFSGPMLALVSTLAGNLLIVGSIANMIVVSAAARHGISIDWRTHARAGIPVTVVTLGITAAWFAVRA